METKPKVLLWTLMETKQCLLTPPSIKQCLLTPPSIKQDPGTRFEPTTIQLLGEANRWDFLHDNDKNSIGQGSI